MQKIIVLDDNEGILEAVSLVLRRKQMEVIALRDPADLEKNIALHQPVLLLMDIFLGGYDGRKICRRLKESQLSDQLWVILFSAQTYSKDSVVESGADAVLNKPFSLKTLYSVIDNMLSKQH